MQPFRLQLSLSGEDLFGLAAALADSPEFGGLPSSIKVDDRDVAVGSDWLAEHGGKAKRTVAAEWNDNPGHFLNIWVGLAIQASIPDVDDPSTWVNRLAALPLSLATVGSPHFKLWKRKRYRPCGFADMHYPHGWVTIIKGDGHGRLVSRRWLEQESWLLDKRDDDTSILQFHALDTDAETAKLQAEPGHKRLGIDGEGGFLQTDYVYENDLSAYLLREKRELRVVVAARETSQREMLDACAFLKYRGDELGFDRVLFVFPVGPQEAEPHLHELWLRELECWTIVDGKEVRLDEDYQPPAPQKPDWA